MCGPECCNLRQKSLVQWIHHSLCKTLSHVVSCCIAGNLSRTLATLAQVEKGMFVCNHHIMKGPPWHVCEVKLPCMCRWSRTYQHMNLCLRNVSNLLENAVCPFKMYRHDASQVSTKEAFGKFFGRIVFLLHYRKPFYSHHSWHTRYRQVEKSLSSKKRDGW